MPKSRPVKVIKADEPWCFVHLEDGTIIKFRPVVMGCIQLLNEDMSPIMDDQGCCAYGLQIHNAQIIEHSPMIEERQPSNINKRAN